MHNTEQTLGTAIAELNCVRPSTNASLDELTALNVARDCVDQLLRNCVTELRADPQTTHTWGAIGYVLDSSAHAVQQKYSPTPTVPALTEPAPAPLLETQPNHEPSDAEVFWEAYAGCFSWNFLPSDFLHALYLRWMDTERPGITPLQKCALTRRLKKVIASESSPGEWFYTRARAHAPMSAAEPITALVPAWTPDTSDKPLYGVRRRTFIQKPLDAGTGTHHR
ncbi:hypothetical protein [Cryobacterium luteum]|uniref:DNA primase/nucleoside triphosphatase C-terminal domain-containing protein n=1 Tax=Cryobacterium luteum TaxID=1424661 RepID=A0A1H8L063_9MICO|nr:hypothetical protein [Cryobacterium luteum]TFB82337.1 hypothetical protein E3O10_17695 [Cryobacterium luteum]SEN98560.1 hypothetical protein SAMN05216281_1235 [Cryobacterium luteum]